MELGQKEQESFQQSKNLLLSSKVLVHFDPKLPVVLACDASSYGVGTVVAHKMPDGTETDWFCFSDIVCGGTTVLTNREERVVMCIWSAKMSCLLTW